MLGICNFYPKLELVMHQADEQQLNDLTQKDDGVTTKFIKAIQKNYLKIERILAQAERAGGIPDDSLAINKLLGYDQK